jgi:hypothetical protein
MPPRSRIEFPLIPSSSATGAAGSAGYPAISHFHIGTFRRDCRLPRIPHLRVLPAFELQVSLKLESFSASSEFSSSRFPRNSVPACHAFRNLTDFSDPHSPALPAIGPRVAPILESFSAASVPASGFPSVSQSNCACQCRFRVYTVPASSGFASNGSPSYLESLVLRRLRHSAFGFPRACFRLRLK